jgi:hypothetical protein
MTLYPAREDMLVSSVTWVDCGSAALVVCGCAGNSILHVGSVSFADRAYAPLQRLELASMAGAGLTFRIAASLSTVIIACAERSRVWTLRVNDRLDGLGGLTCYGVAEPIASFAACSHQQLGSPALQLFCAHPTSLVRYSLIQAVEPAICAVSRHLQAQRGLYPSFPDYACTDCACPCSLHPRVAAGRWK